jgi:hypothetical protein
MRQGSNRKIQEWCKLDEQHPTKEGIRRSKSPRRKRINTNRNRSRTNGEKSRVDRRKEIDRSAREIWEQKPRGASLSSIRKCSPLLRIRRRTERKTAGPEEPKRRGREDERKGEEPPS